MQPKLTVPRDVQAAKYIALVGGEIGTMFGEWKLAHLTGMPMWAAWTLPLLLSLYGYAAFRMGRTLDVGIALGLVAASQGVAHLIAAFIVDVDWRIIIAVWSLMVPVALWRLHQVAKARPNKEIEPDPAPAAKAEKIAPTRTQWKLTEAIPMVWELERKGLKDGQIGQRMGISRVRVGQIRKEAINKNMVPAGAPWVAPELVAA